MNNNINFAAMSTDDIIFLHRNQAYGAYELRKSYNDNIKRALLGTLLIAALGMSYQTIYTYLHHTAPPRTIEEIINVKNMDVIKPPAPKLLQKNTQAPATKKGVQDAATAAAPGQQRPVADQQAPVDSMVQAGPTLALADIAQASTAGAERGSEMGKDLIDMHVSAPAASSSEIHDWVEKMPEYPGGEKALMNFLRDNLVYPEYEKENGIQGKAVVSFVIDEAGKVNDVKIVRGVSKGIDRESMRVISMLQKFSPGIQSGRAVKVRYIVPLGFHLSD